MKNNSTIRIKRVVLFLYAPTIKALFFIPRHLRKIDAILYRGLHSIARKTGPLKPILRAVHAKTKKTEEWFLTYIARHHFRNALSMSLWLVIICSLLLFTTGAKALTATLYPDGDVIRGWANVTGCTATAHWDCLNETTNSTADYVSTGTIYANVTEEYTMSSAASSNVDITKFDVTVYAHSIACNGNAPNCDEISINIRVGGSLQTAQIFTLTATNAAYIATFNGSWSSDADLEVQIVRRVVGGGNPSNADDDVRLTSVKADVTYTVSAAIEQSAYRWFENEDSVESVFNGSGVYTNNVSGTNDAIYTSAKDDTYLYVAGYEGNGGIDWRVQKQRLTDGSLDPDFGSSGVVTSSPTANNDRIESILVDSDYIYLIGYQTISAGNTEWRIEKRNKNTGSLCSSVSNCAAGVFDGDGVYVSSLGSLDDQPYAGILDGNYMYISGYYGAGSGNAEVRVEKRNKTTGALCSNTTDCPEGVFDTDGSIDLALTPYPDSAREVTIDGSYVYLAISESVASDTDSRIRVEKRNKTTGALCSNTTDCPEGVFATAGVYTYNPTGALDTPNPGTLRISGDYLYYAATLNGPIDSLLVKHNKLTGNLCSSLANCSEGIFDTDGMIYLSYSGVGTSFFGLQIDGGSVYWAGHDRSVDGGFSRINIRKYNVSDGSPVTAFGTNGEVFSNPSTNHDEVRDLEVDPASNAMWVSGYDFSQGNAQWRIEKRTLDDGVLLSTANVAPIDVGAALAAQDTVATASAEGTPFRLRMNMHVSLGSVSGGDFKLQYALRGADNVCDTSFTNETYADVTVGSPIAYADNVNAVDGQSMTVNANDPMHTGHTLVRQTYQESNNVSVTSAIADGSDGMWDFVLVDNGASASATYCFRIVYAAGAPLTSYTVIPEITVQSANFEQANHRLFEDSGFTGENWASQTASWSARHYHTSVEFDGKMWVMGGWAGKYMNDVWYTSDGESWTQATSNAGWPGRQGHTSVVYDNKMWVMGGTNGTNLDDVWYSSDGINWTEATQAPGWVPRYNLKSVSFDGKMWINGGYDGSTYRSDVWYTTDGVSWTQATNSPGWAGRSEHTSVVYDNKMWVISGREAVFLLDVWYSSDGITWTQATSSVAYGNRYSHSSVVYDNKMWVIGGNDGANKNDVWYSTNGATWIQATAGASWSIRYRLATLVYDNKMWVMGGIGSTNSKDTWSSVDGASWTETTTSSPWTARELHSSVVFDGKMWVMGGFSSGGRLNDVWHSTNGVDWTQATASAQWSGRSGHTSVVYDNKIWVMGGNDGSTDYNDVWYSSDGITWTQATSGAPWAARQLFDSVVFNNKIWIMGGIFSGGYNDEVWSSTDGVSWTLETNAPGWTGRNRHTTTVYDSKIWIMGGYDGFGHKNDVWYSSDGANWTQATGAAGWSGRETARVLEYDGKMWITGGYNGSVRMNDIWTSTDGTTWTQLTASADWPGREAHTFLALNGKFFIIGGREGVYSNDTWYTSSSFYPGDPLAAQNTAATLTASNQKFRLRMVVPITSKTVFKNGQQLKLQYAPKIGTCDLSFIDENYQDVTSSSPIAYYASTSSQNGDIIKYNAADPTFSGFTRYQSHWLANPITNNVLSISNGQAGMWDFALEDNGAPFGASYCLRIVKNDGGLFNTYSSIPEVSIYTPPNTSSSAPTLSAPSDGSTAVSITPTFQLRSSDADSDYLRYRIEVCSTSNCSVIVRTIDQTVSQTGWSNQDTESGTAYVGSSSLASSTLASHTYQSTALDNSTQYWWRAYAIDPDGTNTWSSASSIYSFTTGASGPPPDGSTTINGGVEIRGGTNIGQ